jgi:hypothetical protein
MDAGERSRRLVRVAKRVKTEDLRSSLEQTHKRLRRLVKTLKENGEGGSKGGEASDDLKTEVRRSRRQLRANRELLGLDEKSE